MGRKPAFYNNYEVCHEDLIGTRIAKRRAQLDAEYKARTDIEESEYINLTQQRLADACGVSRDTVKNWEKGTEYPKLENLETLCRVLDCDYDFLLGRIDVPYVQEYDIEEHLGLSAQSRITLHNLPQISPELSAQFDRFVSSKEFLPLLEAVNKYRKAVARLEHINNNPDPDEFYIIPDGNFVTRNGEALSLTAVRTDKAMGCYMLEALELLKNFIENQ